MLDYVKFQTVPKQGSLIGFISFKYNREYSFYELAVHKLREPKGHIKIRLVYPDKQAPNKQMQESFDEEVNAWLLANNYEDIKKGCENKK